MRSTRDRFSPGGAGRPRRSAPLILALFALLVFSPVGAPAAAQGIFDGLILEVERIAGESVARNVEEEYGAPVRLAPDEQARVEAVFANLVARASRKEIAYSLTILSSDEVNAFAAPAGYVFLTTGILEVIGDDVDALANVLGHEIAHVEHKHGINALTRQLGLGILLQLAFGRSSQTVQTVAAAAVELTRLGWSREQEHESDDLGQRLAAAAGYDPAGMVRFFEVLQGLSGEEIPFLEFLSTHPLTSERIDRARARAAALSR